jgi:hypothetical protein
MAFSAAADFKERREPIEGRYGWILAVKDLASRYQLAWLPVEEATADVVQATCAQLFAEHGVVVAWRSTRAAHGVAGLRPPRRPAEPAHVSRRAASPPINNTALRVRRKPKPLRHRSMRPLVVTAVRALPVAARQPAPGTKVGRPDLTALLAFQQHPVLVDDRDRDLRHSGLAEPFRPFALARRVGWDQRVGWQVRANDLGSNIHVCHYNAPFKKRMGEASRPSAAAVLAPPGQPNPPPTSVTTITSVRSPKWYQRRRDLGWAALGAAAVSIGHVARHFSDWKCLRRRHRS